MSDTTLAEEALEFAKRYCALTDALRSQGVVEDVARDEARVTALYMMFQESRGSGELICPVTHDVCPLREDA